MEQEMGRSMSMEEVYTATGMSMTHFNRLFRHHLGVSPKHYFLSRKMSWAKHLLREGTMPVKSIAAGLGYADPLYFSSQFHRHAGMSPKAFRSGSEAIRG
jgi:AraC-like DNA-binding protein